MHVTDIGSQDLLMTESNVGHHISHDEIGPCQLRGSKFALAAHGAWGRKHYKGARCPRCQGRMMEKHPAGKHEKAIDLLQRTTV